MAAKPNDDLSTKTALVYDNGLFADIAVRLARDFGRVYYYMPWKRNAPRSNQLLVGEGLDGVQRVRNFWDVMPSVDCFVFPDVLDGDLQVYLRGLGKPVWGSGKGENLELFRPEAKEVMKAQGMPVNDYEVVEGMDALRDLLKSVKNRYVKISLTRGDMESFHHLNYRQSEPLLDELEHDLGPRKRIMQFLVETPIDDAIEVGVDTWCIDGRWPSVAMNGIEIKDQGYLGAVIPYAKLNDPIRYVNEALAPTLQDFLYRGFWSTEIRIGSDERPYLIDVTARAASPPSESYQEVFSNYPHIIWAGAHGQLITPKAEAHYVAQAMIVGEFSDDLFQPVDFPQEISRWVKLYRRACIQGQHYVVPQDAKMTQCGYVVGLGDTIEEAVAACREHAEQVKGLKVTVKLDAIGDAIEQVRKMEDMGITFSDEPVPEEVNA